MRIRIVVEPCGVCGKPATVRLINSRGETIATRCEACFEQLEDRLRIVAQMIKQGTPERIALRWAARPKHRQ